MDIVKAFVFPGILATLGALISEGMKTWERVQLAKECPCMTEQHQQSPSNSVRVK